ncbi:MAG: anti-sigma factor [Marmoricola sp.]
MRATLSGALNGHVGSRVSALVDGQLSEAEADRVWAHVMVCPPCRRLVEQEGWTKTRVRSTVHAPDVCSGVPRHLLGSLYEVEARAELRAEIVAEVRAEFQKELRAEVGRVERAARRRATLAMVGVSSMSVAVVGLMAVTASPTERVEYIPQHSSTVAPAPTR